MAECDLDDEASYADADVVILGAPFDGGTSYRAGARFGPQAIRMTDYLPHDCARPSLALRTDGLQDLKVYDAGDVEMYSGDIARRSVLANRAPRLLATARNTGLDGIAANAIFRDDRDRAARFAVLLDRGVRHRHRRV